MTRMITCINEYASLNTKPRSLARSSNWIKSRAEVLSARDTQHEFWHYSGWASKRAVSTAHRFMPFDFFKDIALINFLDFLRIY
jgi:hypothetical protein